MGVFTEHEFRRSAAPESKYFPFKLPVPSLVSLGSIILSSTNCYRFADSAEADAGQGIASEVDDVF